MKRTIATVFVVSLLLSLVAFPALAQGIQSVELHGYMQNRFYANPNYSARFVTERVSLSAIGRLNNDTTGYLEVYFHPWLTDKVLGVAPNQFTAEQFRTYVESAYVDMPLANGRLRLGKGRQLNFGLTPSYPNRKTSQYGILAETFTQDRIIGAQYDQKMSTFDIGASLYTDQRVMTRSIGDFAGAVNGADLVSTVKHFVDKDDPANNTGRLAGSVRLGVTKPNYQFHASGAVGRLTQTDAAYIASQYPAGVPVGDKAHNKYGLDGSWSHGPWILQSEFYQGNFSFLKITGYQVLVGYQPRDKMRAYVRWSALNNNRSPNGAVQPTWDTQQLTFGVVQPISKGVWVEANYEKNSANPGAGVADKKDDLLFLEVFTGF